MAKVYTEEELNNFSRETLMAVILSMQDQIHQLNTNMERLIEQIADANNKRYGRSSEKLETISGQLELELIFNETYTDSLPYTFDSCSKSTANSGCHD